MPTDQSKYSFAKFNFMAIGSIILLVTVLIAAPSAKADVYRWKQPDGTVVYSDEASPEAEKIEVKALPVINLPVPTGIRTKKKSSTASNERYNLAITSPTHDSTVRDNTGTLLVSTSISPILKKEHLLQLTLDGGAISQPGTSTSFRIQGANRGSHQLAVQVIDNNGDVIQSSSVITVHVVRQSKLH